MVFHGKEKVRSSRNGLQLRDKDSARSGNAAGTQVRTNGVPGWTGIDSPLERRVLQ